MDVVVKRRSPTAVQKMRMTARVWPEIIGRLMSLLLRHV